MNDKTEDIGMQLRETGRIVKCRMLWAGHLVWMVAGRLSKKADAIKQQTVGKWVDVNKDERTALREI